MQVAETVAPGNTYPSYLAFVRLDYVGAGTLRVRVYDEGNLRVSQNLSCASFGALMTSGMVVASPGDSITATVQTTSGRPITVTNLSRVLMPQQATL